MQALPGFFRSSSSQIPDASEEITLPCNSHSAPLTSTLKYRTPRQLFPFLTHCFHRCPVISFFHPVCPTILTSSLFSQMSFLTQALFCCLALDAWYFLQLWMLDIFYRLSPQIPEAYSVTSVSLQPLSDFCSFWVDSYPHASSITSWADNSACILAFHF